MWTCGRADYRHNGTFVNLALLADVTFAFALGKRATSHGDIVDWVVSGVICSDYAGTEP